jgi:hypothetical protein
VNIIKSRRPPCATPASLDDEHDAVGKNDIDDRYGMVSGIGTQRNGGQKLDNLPLRT